MTMEVEDLLIQPFREVVERGQEAQHNVEDGDNQDQDTSKQMLRSAGALVKEGERALQRLQPIWQSQVAKYGEAFTGALRDNEEILDKQRTLEDLLYDLDDYVTLETFDADRFSQVQAASKSFALTLLETIKRVRIPEPARSVSTPTTVASSEPPWPQPKLIRTNTKSYVGPSDTVLDTVEESRPRRPSTPDILGAERESVRVITNGRLSHSSSARSPTSGRISAWVKEQTADSPDHWGGTGHSPTGTNGHMSLSNLEPHARTVNGYVSVVSNLDELTRQGSANRAPSGHYAPTSPDDELDRSYRRDSERMISRLHSPGASPTADTTERFGQYDKMPGRPYSPLTAGSRTSAYTSTESSHSGRRRSSVIVPTSDSRTTSLAARNIPPSAIHYGKRNLPSLPLSPPNSLSERNFENGLMLANESASDVSGGKTLKRTSSNCQIGPQSTLYQLKGFCEGAQKFQKDGHSSSTKAAMEYGTNGSVARCVDCEFRRPLAEVELDARKDATGNRRKAGVLYRIRFLYKCHMPVQSAHTVRYGCLFCVQQGHTTHEGDSTVFTKEEYLFQHLARHPQPLPAVPGVTVLYGDIATDDPQREDYDIHLPDPPAASPYPEMADLGMLPIATANKAHERRYGERPLEDPDGGKDVLEFFAGSNIVGIEFPIKWKGKWCTGWQNGVKGAFPMKLITIQAPRRLPGMEFSGLAVTTRWKLDFKEHGQGWLSFGADETISNVSWVTEDDWCWSGVTKKGKSGIFPKSHIIPETVHQDGRPRTSGAAKSGFGGGNFLSRRLTNA